MWEGGGAGSDCPSCIFLKLFWGCSALSSHLHGVECTALMHVARAFGTCMRPGPCHRGIQIKIWKIAMVHAPSWLGRCLSWNCSDSLLLIYLQVMSSFCTFEKNKTHLVALHFPPVHLSRLDRWLCWVEWAPRPSGQQFQGILSSGVQSSAQKMRRWDKALIFLN